MSRPCWSGSKRCDRLRRPAKAIRSVCWLSADSLPRRVAFKVRSRRGAKRDIVVSGSFHDNPDRVHNDLWLVDLHDVAGLFSDDPLPLLRNSSFAVRRSVFRGRCVRMCSYAAPSRLTSIIVMSSDCRAVPRKRTTVAMISSSAPAGSDRPGPAMAASSRSTPNGSPVLFSASVMPSEGQVKTPEGKKLAMELDPDGRPSRSNDPQ